MGIKCLVMKNEIKGLQFTPASLFYAFAIAEQYFF